jgi:2-polyprenyl-6-methoxyphenol hydroxylase-like FAD-dependent oxidoreductase
MTARTSEAWVALGVQMWTMSTSSADSSCFMSAVHSVLVIGAGLAGTTCAIRLTQARVAVDLVDRQADFTALGSGITLQGNALRALQDLGVWEQVEERGYGYNSLGLRAPDPNGTLIAELDEMRTDGADLPATAGMYRPDLARILLDRAIEVGARPRLGGTRFPGPG